MYVYSADPPRQGPPRGGVGPGVPSKACWPLGLLPCYVSHSKGAGGGYAPLPALPWLRCSYAAAVVLLLYACVVVVVCSKGGSIFPLVGCRRLSPLPGIPGLELAIPLRVFKKGGPFRALSVTFVTVGLDIADSLLYRST